jgi:uncharacterized membrane protein
MLVILVLLIVDICKKKKDEGMEVVEGFDTDEDETDNENSLFYLGLVCAIFMVFTIFLIRVDANLMNHKYKSYYYGIRCVYLWLCYFVLVSLIHFSIVTDKDGMKKKNEKFYQENVGWSFVFGLPVLILGAPLFYITWSRIFILMGLIKENYKDVDSWRRYIKFF